MNIFYLMKQIIISFARILEKNFFFFYNPFSNFQINLTRINYVDTKQWLLILIQQVKGKRRIRFHYS